MTAAEPAAGARSERRLVLWTLAAVTAAFLLLGGIGDILAPDVSRVEATRRCLVGERGFLVFEASLAPALEADDGALETAIEGNGVTYALAGSPAEAERIARAFGRLRPAGFVEVRGRNVYRWDAAPSPTQRQAAYDCSY